MIELTLGTLVFLYGALVALIAYRIGWRDGRGGRHRADQYAETDADD